MERPNKDNYRFDEWHQELITYNYDEYEYDLEHYIDELEQEIKEIVSSEE